MSSIYTGTIKWFNSQKGFGFIVPDDGGKDVFVHIKAVEKAGLNSVQEGDRLKYDLEEFKGRVSAQNLRAA